MNSSNTITIHHEKFGRLHFIQRDKDGFATDESLDEMCDNSPFILVKARIYDGYTDIEVTYETDETLCETRGEVERHTEYIGWFKAPDLFLEISESRK